MAEDDAPPSRRSRSLFAVILVFALGTIFGAALTVGVILHLPFVRAFIHHRADGRDPARIERLIRDLDLDPEQEAKLRAIVERIHGDMNEILERSRREVRAFLRPDQQMKFDRIHTPSPPFPHLGHPPPRPEQGPDH